MLGCPITRIPVESEGWEFFSWDPDAAGDWNPGSRGHATFIISHNGKTSLALFLGNVTFAKHLTLREISHMFHFLRSAIFISIHFMLRVVSFSKKNLHIYQNIVHGHHTASPSRRSSSTFVAWACD